MSVSSGFADPAALASDTPHRRRLPLTLMALGVVYGDIGTSPLYALRECFFSSHSVLPTHENVLGVLSLIIWALVLVISVKYVAIVMRADNQGEGGVLALTALIPGSGGFMEDPDVPESLRLARARGLPLDIDDLTYFLGRETIIVTRRKGMAIWRERLFVLMARNAVRATAFFRLPPERVVELGVQVEM